MQVELTCEYCGKPFVCYHKNRLLAEHHFCSRECNSKYKTEHNPNYEICPVCGKKFHLKPSDKEKAKAHGNVCSYECMGKLRSEKYKGENNPNYGNRGKLNPLYHGERISVYGYRLVHKPDHPFANGDGYVFEHRLIAEQNLLTPETSVVINGVSYLSPDYIVHHKDHNRLNNDVNNLQIMTLAEHTKFHAEEARNKKKEMNIA